MDELWQLVAEKGTTYTGETPSNCGFLIEKVLQTEKYCIHHAIDIGCQKLLRLLLKSGASPNQLDAEGNTPLHKVAHLDDFELAFGMAQQLIDAGTNVLAMDSSCLTSHYYAVKKENIKLLRLLLRNGIDHGIGCLVLMEAVALQNLTIVKMLIDATPHLSPKNIGTCLHYPIYDNAELVRLLIDSGADIDVVDPVSGAKPLNVAALCGNPETVKILLNACADIDHVCQPVSMLQLGDYKPGSALHDAVFAGHIEVVELLLKHKANINALNYYGYSVLYTAANRTDCLRKIDEETHLKMLRILLAHGADMYRYGECGNCYMPFKAILKDGNMDAVQLFLDYGADCDEICLDDENEDTVVHLAARNEDTSVLEFALVQRPNDIHKFSLDGGSPLFIAVRDRMPNNVDMLIKYGADVNCSNSDGFCKRPLYLAVIMEEKECIEILLNNGADIDFKTETNQDVSILGLALTLHRDYSISPYEVIVEHIALLDMKGAFVDSKNHSLMKSREDIWEYYELCESELVRMQDSVVDGQITFYSLLVDKDIIGYARNQQVIDTFENQSIDEIFPLYGCRVSKRVRQARTRVKLLDDATSGLSSLLDFDVLSYYMIYENILKYIPEEDLHTLGELKQDSS